MGNFSYARNERIYLQVESAYGTLPNAGGTASLTGAACCRHTKAVLTPQLALLTRRDKTGTRSAVQGVPGRRAGSWSLSMDLAANGAGGVVPDCDPILQAIFGQAATISSGVSCTYAFPLPDAIKTFDIWSFRTPSTMMQRAAAGCTVREATFELGQDIAALSAQGDAMWVVDTVNFSTLDSVGKAGLTTFPTEPATPVTNGAIIAGFTGVATFDSNVLANIRSATLKIGTGNEVTKDTFGTFYAVGPEGDVRNISLSFNLYDGDDAASQDLQTKAVSKSPINVTLQIGTITGAKWTFTVKNVQLAMPALEDGQRKWACVFGESRAFASSITVVDEVSLVIS